MSEADVSKSALGRDPDTNAAVEDRVPESGYFVLRLGGSLYAISTDSVDHVTPRQRPIRVPTAASYIRGVVHLRGRIITVIDLAQLLGLTSDVDSAQQHELGRRLLVLDVTGGLLAAEATEVIGLREVRDDAVRPVQDVMAESADLLAGQYEGSEGVVTIINADALYQALLSRRGQTSW